MKTIVAIILLLLAHPAGSALCAKSNPSATSIYINSPDSSVHAYITAQTTNLTAKCGYVYYWYASNQLCYTDGGYSGRLLHGIYSSYYPNHFLLAQGNFKLGLKDGCWKRWFSNGMVHEIVHYNRGKLDGSYEVYASSGELLMRMYYRNGVRAGKTKIFSQGKTDSVIRYKKGVPVVPKKDRKKDKLNKQDTVSPDSSKTPVRIRPLKKRDVDTRKSDSVNVRKQRFRFFRRDSAAIDSTNITVAESNPG